MASLVETSKQASFASRRQVTLQGGHTGRPLRPLLLAPP